MTDKNIDYSAQDIDNFPQRYRANFINCLSGFKSACLLGTTDGSVNNLAVISSVVHVGANPPLLGIIMRPHTVQRDSLNNIKQQGCYTLNNIHTQWTDKAHQTSARYPQETSEFDEVGLTPWFSESFTAPYVAESTVKIGLKVEQHFTLCNQSEMIIGKIQQVLLAKNEVDNEGYINIESLGSACISGLDCYHSTHKIAQYEYAKPHIPTRRK